MLILSICRFFIIVLFALSPMLPKIPYVVTEVGLAVGKDIVAFAIVVLFCFGIQLVVERVIKKPELLKLLGYR